MKNSDVIFKFYKPDELRLVDCSCYSHFGWEGSSSFAFETVAEGYKIALDTLFEKMKASKGNFRVLDTLIYPFCFLARHLTELCIKTLYVNLSGCDEAGLKSFLKSNHDLQTCWSIVKPILSAGKRKVGTKVDIGAMEHYIHEIQVFDPKSMRMRYPINKSLEPANAETFVDIFNLYEKFSELYDAFVEINYDLTRQIRVQMPEKDIDIFLSNYRKVLVEIKTFLSQISSYKEANVGTFRVEDILCGRTVEGFIASQFASLSDNAKIIVEVLYYCGGDIIEETHKLSLKPDERVNDFVSLCLNNMKYSDFEFGMHPDDSQFNVISKRRELIIKNINHAISVLG